MERNLNKNSNVTKMKFFLISLFILLNGKLVASQDTQIQLFSDTVNKLSMTNANSIFKSNAFPEDIEDTYARGRVSIPWRENKGNIKKINSLLKDKELIQKPAFEKYLSNFLQKSDQPPLICFLIISFVQKNPDNVKYAKKFLSLLVNKAKNAEEKEKWKYLYIIEQFFRNIYYNAKFDKYAVNQLELLYPNSGLFPLDKETESIMKDLHGENEINKLKKTVPKIQTYDSNAYVQFTFILFSYVYFRKDECKQYAEDSKKQRESMRNQKD